MQAKIEGDHPQDRNHPQDVDRPPHQPIFNLPTVIVVFAVLFCVIRLTQDLFYFDGEARVIFILWSAFLPVRYVAEGAQLPPVMAAYWTPISYAFLHADWLHLGVNTMWMAAFGTPVARRFGTVRFVVLSLVAAIAGAITHMLFFFADIVPLVGASAMVSAYMGAAVRFAFGHGSGLSADPQAPALSISQTFANRSTFSFVAVWFALNYFTGTGALNLAGEHVSIAWQAHIGGFLVGLLGFRLFDR